MSNHRKQAEALKRLGISHRAAGKDLNVPQATLGAYFLKGLLPKRLTTSNFAERLQRYIDKRSGQLSSNQYRVAPIRGKFSQLGLSLEQIGEATGVGRMVAKSGIYDGFWPDERTKNLVESWIDRRVDLGEDKMINPVSLTQEHLDHFSHLKFDPWGEITNPKDILVTREIAHALKLCKSCIDRGEMLAITGPVGSGKTILLRKVDEWSATRSDIVLVKPAVLEKQYLRGSHIVSAILEDLDMVPGSHSSLEHSARFLRRALEQAHADGRIAVLVIDECHLTPLDSLLFLKRLHEVEKDGEKLLRILLVGQPTLARQLRTNFHLSEIGQRMRLHELGGLNGATAAYIRHRLDRAGAAGRDIFDSEAIKLIAKKCSTPLEVNACAALAMVAAYSVGEKVVTKEAVEMVQGGYRG